MKFIKFNFVNPERERERERLRTSSVYPSSKKSNLITRFFQKINFIIHSFINWQRNRMNKAVNIINGENNIIIVVKKNIEYINNYSKIPLGFKINISGSNNVIKLCLPIKTKDFNINICDREKGVKNYNDNYIEIGSILVWGSVNIACQGSKNKITIGKGTRINTKLSIKTERATLSIGEDCLISDADFWVTDYHDVIDAEGNKINKQKHPCIIGKHCWLGANTTFLKNAQIAENCIVGVGAVVGKVFSESNCCICGNPANIVKRGVNWK